MPRFSGSITEKLTSAGWYEGRNVLESVHIPKSFKPFPVALAVLQEFGNLTIWGRSTLCLDPSLEEGLEVCLLEYERAIGLNLCLLGQLDDGHGSIVIDEIGRVYSLWGVSGEFVEAGNNFDKALTYLLEGYHS